MTSDTAKMISTAAIWLGTSMAITFGMCRMEVDGPLIFLCVVSTVIGATVSTTVIWAPWTLKKEQPQLRAFEVVEPHDIPTAQKS